jgi:hypothetical protein
MSGEAHVSHNELNYFDRDLGLSKSKAGLLWARLQQWKLSDDKVKIPAFRFRQKYLSQCFKTGGNLVACRDVSGLVTVLNS